MRVRFRCGCVHELNPDRVADPSCPTHQARVARVLGRVQPTIKGHGAGPLVQGAPLEAIPVKLAPQGPLVLKPREEN